MGIEWRLHKRMVSRKNWKKLSILLAIVLGIIVCSYLHFGKEESTQLRSNNFQYDVWPPFLILSNYSRVSITIYSLAWLSWGTFKGKSKSNSYLGVSADVQNYVRYQNLLLQAIFYSRLKKHSFRTIHESHHVCILFLLKETSWG